MTATSIAGIEPFPAGHDDALATSTAALAADARFAGMAFASRRNEAPPFARLRMRTGGIRGEKAALWLHASAMDQVLQLDSGILVWFDAVGHTGFEGRCVVFDARFAIDAQAVRSAGPVPTRPAARAGDSDSPGIALRGHVRLAA